MIYLLLVSIIWGFSFVIIKSTLVSLDSNFVSFVRMLISVAFFLPFTLHQFSNLLSNLFLRIRREGGKAYRVDISAYFFSVSDGPEIDRHGLNTKTCLGWAWRLFSHASVFS